MELKKIFAFIDSHYADPDEDIESLLGLALSKLKKNANMEFVQKMILAILYEINQTRSEDIKSPTVNPKISIGIQIVHQLGHNYDFYNKISIEKGKWVSENPNDTYFDKEFKTLFKDGTIDFYKENSKCIIN